MGTSFVEINDLFMMLQNDYRLIQLYQTSIDNFNTYLEAWLILSIDDFDICNQSLAYTASSGSVVGVFTEDLYQKNKNILAQIMVKYWLQKEVQDVLQMNNLIQDHDFKTFSQAQNLAAKKDYYSAKKEELSQLMVDYGYKNNDWESWKNQIF